MVDAAEVCRFLEARGDDLAGSLEAAVVEAAQSPKAQIHPAGVVTLPPGRTPDDLPPRGAIMTHLGMFGSSGTQAKITVGWFLPEAFVQALCPAGDAPVPAEKLQALADEWATALNSEPYTFAESTPQLTEDAWGDFLAGELPVETAWQKFQVTGIAEEPVAIYLAWPASLVESPQGAASAAPKAEVDDPPTPPSPAPGPKKIPEKILRVLRTEVPLIVTLASKQESAGKVLQIGIGSILEFDQSCDAPLQFSVNNLPIGFGEAVKIGDHFGLRVTSVLSPEERIERMGGKWSF